MRDFQCLCLPTAYSLLICALIVWGCCDWSLFCYALLSDFFTFAIIPSDEEMAGCSTLIIVFLLALLIVFGALSLFLKVSWVGLQCVMWHFLVIFIYFLR